MALAERRQTRPGDNEKTSQARLTGNQSGMAKGSVPAVNKTDRLIDGLVLKRTSAPKLEKSPMD